MILMSVFALWAEHHVRGTRTPEIMKFVLDALPIGRCSPVRYVEDGHIEIRTRTERDERVTLFVLPLGARAGEDETAYPQPRKSSRQAQ